MKVIAAAAAALFAASAQAQIKHGSNDIAGTVRGAKGPEAGV